MCFSRTFQHDSSGHVGMLNSIWAIRVEAKALGGGQGKPPVLRDMTPAYPEGRVLREILQSIKLEPKKVMTKKKKKKRMSQKVIFQYIKEGEKKHQHRRWFRQSILTSCVLTAQGFSVFRKFACYRRCLYRLQQQQQQQQ